MFPDIFILLTYKFLGQIWDKNHIKIIKFMQIIINIKFSKVVWKGLFTAVLNGGADRGRTDDLLHAMQALCQLSYSPII